MEESTKIIFEFIEVVVAEVVVMIAVSLLVDIGLVGPLSTWTDLGNRTAIVGRPALVRLREPGK